MVAARVETRTKVFAGRTRHFPGIWGKAVLGLSVATALFIFFYLLDIQRYFGFFIDAAQFRLLTLGLFVVLTLLYYPMRSSKDLNTVPWYDFVLIALTLAGILYPVIFWAEIREQFTAPTTLQVVLGLITILVILESTRRAVGWPVPIIAVCFFLYALFSEHFPGLFSLPGHSLSRVAAHIYYGTGGLTGMIVNIIVTVVTVFVFFGALLQGAGGAKLFMNLALAFAGRFTGGAAKVAVIASALFGTISGSPMANASAVGVITIPLMKSAGHPPHYAAAVEAVASTGGLIMPPVMGAAAFIMAGFLETSYWSVCVASALPALLYFVAAFMVIHFESAKSKLGGVSRSQIPPLGRTLKEGWQFLLPLALLVYLLAMAGWTAQRSCMFATATVIVVAMFRKETRWTFRGFISSLDSGVRSLMSIVPIAGTLAVITGVMSLTGLGVALGGGLVKAVGGNLILLLLMAAVTAYIFGMGISFLATYIILAVMVVPPLVQMGILPMAAHLFIMYLSATAFFTPPVALDVFVTAAIAGAPVFRTGLTAMRLAVASYIVPFFFVFSPALLLQGDITRILVDATTAVIGIIALAGAVSRYLWGHLNWPQTIITFLAGLLLVWPAWQISIAGVAALTLVIISVFRQRRRARATEMPKAEA